MSKPVHDRALASGGLGLLVVLGIAGLALLVLVPDYAQARLDSLQPVSIQSGLQANYSADPLGLAIQPVDMKVVAQVIADHATSTLPVQEQAATAMGALQTPVFTLTPSNPNSRSATAFPTNPGRAYTITALAFTPTGLAVAPTQSQGSSPTPIETLTLPPIGTITASLTVSKTPQATTPGVNVTAPAKPTMTPRPTLTYTPIATHMSTLLPPTQPGVPTATFTPTSPWTATQTSTALATATSTKTSTPVPPAVTHTFTPAYTSTPIPSGTPTRTFTPSFTATSSPVPPTRTFTPTKTMVSYPPPPTNTPTTAPYP